MSSPTFSRTSIIIIIVWSGLLLCVGFMAGLSWKSGETDAIMARFDLLEKQSEAIVDTSCEILSIQQTHLVPLADGCFYLAKNPEVIFQALDGKVPKPK